MYALSRFAHLSFAVLFRYVWTSRSEILECERFAQVAIFFEISVNFFVLLLGLVARRLAGR